MTTSLLADKNLTHQTHVQALKVALIGATMVVLAQGGSTAATITVHPPDGEDRVFVDVVGKIDDGDFGTFKEKTDQIYPIGAGHPKRQVIVTLVSYGGLIGPLRRGPIIETHHLGKFYFGTSGKN